MLPEGSSIFFEDAFPTAAACTSAIGVCGPCCCSFDDSFVPLPLYGVTLGPENEGSQFISTCTNRSKTKFVDTTEQFEPKKNIIMP